MREAWKDIKGYEGYYQVSNLGRVRSCDRIVKHNNGQKQHRKGRTLKLCSAYNGYLRIGLRKNGKQKMKSIHRLVAQTFIPNPNELPEVNHKDEDKTNNCISNLEWCSAGYNCNFGTRNARMAKAQSKQVLQFTLDGRFITHWPSVMEVHRQTGFSQGSISKCCNGKLKTAYGYQWRFKSNAKN